MKIRSEECEDLGQCSKCITCLLKCVLKTLVTPVLYDENDEDVCPSCPPSNWTKPYFSYTSSLSSLY